MNSCLQLKKSNCKNCYKCIRFCPVKAIKVEDHQAHIIKEECILCGRCFVHCPQNAKQVRDDLPKAKALVNSGADTYVSLAPSFTSAFDGADISQMEAALKALGFCAAEETAVGAAIVNREYERLIKDSASRVIISSCCPSVNKFIQKKYPTALRYLAQIVSPMMAHCLALKAAHENCKTVFIGPCISKKDEGDNSDAVDCVLTFEELFDWLSEAKINVLDFPKEEKGNGRRTRLYPTEGGIIRSMNKDPNWNYIGIAGLANCSDALEDIESGEYNNCFIEMSACRGSCIGGPVVGPNRTRRITSVIDIERTAGKQDFDIPFQNLPLSRQFAYESSHTQMPGSMAIAEILHKMGKSTPQQELNCGSCGYNTCREKAVAVLLGKADLTMCLPYLKEKAETFSDTIINNTPNGIFVLDEQLNIQQINAAALKLFNIHNVVDAEGEPVMKFLNPSDYMLCMMNGKNVYDNRRYLDEYDKFVEETIIYDKEYQIIMSIMKDVTDEESIRRAREEQNQKAVEITDRVVEKHMRTVQEIASLLGETTAETKIALTKLKETLIDD